MMVLWGLYILIAIGIYKLTKRFSVNKWVHRSVLAILILIPTYDIILTNILGGYYCLTTPSAYVNKKVEYPLNIYWEDNVYPGFSTEDRKLMIINYLDGVHLKSMALNGDDGKVYVYEINSSNVWQPLKALKYDSGKEHFDTLNKIAENIMQTSQKIYTKQNMPKMNYTVTFDEIRLNPLSRKFLYSDETKVIDNNTSKVIAYNRIYMPFFYHIAPDFALGNRYYDSWGFELCKSQNYLFYDGDGFKFIGFYGSAKHTVDLNNKLYKKYIKGGK